MTLGNIYGYVRVSTKEQNTDRQLIALLGAGVDKENIFVDKISGKDFERPSYKRLINRLRKGDTLFVKSIDRLGRNYGDALKDNGDWVVFSGYSSQSNNASTSSYSVFNFYYNKNGTYWSCGGDNWIGSISGFPKPVDDKDIRRVAVLDAKNKTLVLTTAGFTNYTGTCTGYRDFNYRTVKIGAWYHGANGFAPLRIYGCRIFEDDVLVRDLRPCVQNGLAGLKDEVDGSFLACGTRTYGGPIPHEQGDGYIESTTRNISIDTGYYANSNTCIWADWAFTSRDNSSAAGGQHFVFETQTPIIGRIYGNGSSGAASDTSYAWNYSTSGQWISTEIRVVTNVRHQAYIDSYGDRVLFMDGSYTNYYTTMTAKGALNQASCTKTLKLFSNASATANFALMRLYGFKIWDAGTLVRDYIPYIQNGAAGLYDRVNGTFVTAGRHALTYGGDIESDGGAMDAYIESDGTQGIDTEYLMRGSESRVEADFAFTDTDKVGNNYQQRAFGQDSGGGMLTAFYITGSGTFNFGFGNTFINNHGPQVTADVRRHRAVIDGYHNRLHYITGNVTNNSYDISGDAHSNVATWPMGIFATPNNQTATTWRNPAKMKLFSFRIYEKDELKHEYLPYKKGNVIGLYDTVDKVVKTDARNAATPFKINGKGVDGAERWIVTPQNVRLSKRDGSATLSANAAGAVSYRWTRDGAAVAGGEDGDLTVEWEKAKTGTVETYAVVPLYDICGNTSEGEPVSVTVEHLSAGTLLLFR